MLKHIVLLLGLALLIGPASYAQENQVDSDFNFGKELFQNKMYDLAEQQFSKFLREYPTSPSAGQARYYLAMSQYDQKKFADAATNFQAFAVQYPSDPLAPQAWVSAGESFAKVKDYANAGLSYERLRVFYPKDINAPSSLLKAADYFELAGDTARAEVSLLTIVQDYSSSPSYYDATLQLGNLYFGSGQLTPAENQFKALLTSDNDSVRVMGLLALGRLNRLRGMPTQAEGYLRDAAALKIAPQSYDAILEEIEIDLDAGNFTVALQQLDRVDQTKLDRSQTARIRYERAYATLAAEGAKTSANNLKPLLALPAKYRLRIAALLKTKRDYRLALSVLGELSRNEMNERDLTLGSEIAFRAGHLKLADSLLSLAASTSKKPDVRAVVRLLDIENNNLKDAEKTRETFFRYENVLKDRPDAYDFYRARSEEGMGNYTAAIADYQDIHDRFPESDYAAAADSLARYDRDFKEVNYRDAVVSMADILLEQGSANRISALFHLGELYEDQLKDYAKASRVYKELESIASGDTQRVANYLYAKALEKNSNDASEQSEAYAVYKSLASGTESDTIAEKSLFRVAEIQAEANDSINAENTSLQFLKRFPNSVLCPRVYTILAGALYANGAYHEAIVQAGMASQLPEAALIAARSEIAIDSLQDAKQTLETLIQSGARKKTLLQAKLVYANLLQRLGQDAMSTYLGILDELVPSDYKDNVSELLANYLYQSGRYDSAYSVYRTIGADRLWYTASPAMLYKMAYCKLKTGDLKDAKNIFREVATYSADSAAVQDAYEQLGKIYSSLGDDRMAASFFERAGESDPGALLTSADIYFEMGDYENASRVYGNILRTTTSDTARVLSAARLVEVNYLTDNLKTADLDAAKFRKTYGDAGKRYYGWFLVDKAEYYIRNKKYKEAEKLLDDVKSDYERTTAYPRSLLDRAQIYVEGNDLTTAENTLKELLKKFPSDQVVPEAHLELGNIYYAQEKFQDASDNFRAVYLDSLADQKIVRDAMSQLISSYESLGMYDGALDITRKFIARFPDDKSIMDKRIKVGILYEELRYFDQALITFQGLVKEANRDYQAELHYYIGAIYDDKGDYANAILEFLKVPYLVTPNAVVDWAAQSYYMAGKCYEQLNKPNEAIAMYQKIVDKPNTDPTFITGAKREINRVKALLK